VNVTDNDIRTVLGRSERVLTPDPSTGLRDDDGLALQSGHDETLS
jgi:hypothetical protein